MTAPLLKRIFQAPGKFFRDKRSVTAVALALMAVPMFIAGEAAVNIARIATARTLLQAAVDNAASAGASAWHLSESPAYANSVTVSTFKGAASNLSTFGSYSTPTPSLACNGVSTVCNATSDTTSYVTTPSTYNCPEPSSAQYCVKVTAQVVIHNWLANHLIPTSALTVTGYGQQALTTAISGKNIPPSPGFGSAGDVSGIYAYAVPMSGSGSAASPNFSGTVSPNSACSSYSSIGPLALMTQSNGAASTCNYLFIALSTSSGTAGSGGSITLQNNQPIAFSFINYTGANGYHSSNHYTTTTALDVKEDSGSYQYYSGGYTVPSYQVQTGTSTIYTTTVTNYSCAGSTVDYYDTSQTGTSSAPAYSCYSNDIQTGNPTTTTSSSGQTGGPTETCSYTVRLSIQTTTTGSNGHKHTTTTYDYVCQVWNVTTTTSQTNPVYTTYPATTLSGSCPDHTLYGSLDSVSVNSTTGANNDGIPVSDSLNVYSSAYEILGEPPTYETNHALIPFVSPFSSSQKINGHTYTVKAICPNYSRSGTSISAPISTTSDSTIGESYATLTGWTGLNIYSTAFPGQTYSDSAANSPEDTSGLYTSDTSIMMTNGSNDYYPPGISACTGAYNASDGGVTPTSDDPWWNWTNSNVGNCPNESSSYKSSTSLSMPPNSAGFVAANTLPNGNQSYEPSYNDCALIIQDLGTGGGNTPNVPVNSSNQALLPDYYLLVESSSGTIIGLDPIYDGKSWYDRMPGVVAGGLNSIDSNISVSSTNSTYVTDQDTAATYNSSGTISSAGFIPTSTNSYTISSLTYGGVTYSNVTVTVEPPALDEFSLPPVTSHQCYNPASNGNSTATDGVLINAGQGETVPFTATSGSTGNLPVTANSVDPVANPQLGAILCDSANPETYALYWNDLGTYESDDIGYWNAITAFTCSVPGSTRSGGLATLSG